MFTIDSHFCAFVESKLKIVLLFFSSVWSYRVPPPMPKKNIVMLANGLGGLAWWWILYHIATEPEHIIVSTTSVSRDDYVNILSHVTY